MNASVTTTKHIPGNKTSAANPHASEEVRAAWVQAVRLRTLPLAASGSFVAAGIAALHGVFRPGVFALMFIVSMLLQVIANFADDYGDLSHGLDDETRVGPRRGMQRGIITPAQMRRALIALCAVTFALGCVLIAVSFAGGPAMDGNTWVAIGAFVVLGIASIAAAILYTVGPHPYGYLGLGDIMSALFFGVVAVVGGSFLYLHQLDVIAVLAGVALGLPVAAVMNINNMRDSTADAAKGKRTIANRLYEMGARRAVAASDARAEDGEPLAAFGVAAIGNAGGATASVACEDLPSSPAAIRTGELAMRRYHKALIWGSFLLFVLAIVFTSAPAGLQALRLIILCAAFTPLMRATAAVCRQLDHTKLDRFMAPTSMGTVLVALGVTVCLVLV